MTVSTFAPEQLVAALNAADVAYVIVGGIAVAAHGVVRATADLDIVPDGRPENLDRLADTLSELGAEHPIDGKLTGAPGTIGTVCSLTDLRAMKLASGRPRDLADIAELEELHGPSLP